jgi:Putative transposase of IS4/5 family (DUF4096)
MARTSPLLKDDQWLKLEPLLPKMMPGKKGGRPWRNNRPVLEGILWVLKGVAAPVLSLCGKNSSVQRSCIQKCRNRHFSGHPQHVGMPAT